MPSRAKQEERFATFGMCELASIDVGRNRQLFYAISVQPGLFETIIERRWGRLERPPRVKEEFFPDLPEALRKANNLYRQGK